MNSDDVLLVLLPSKLLPLELSALLYLLALGLESLMGHVVNFLQILNVLLAFLLSVVVHLEWSLRSHEVWVCLGVIAVRNLLSVQSQTYYSSNVIAVVCARAVSRDAVLGRAIEVVRSLVEPVHVLVALGQVVSLLVCRFSLLVLEVLIIVI